MIMMVNFMCIVPQLISCIHTQIKLYWNDTYEKEDQRFDF